MACRCGPTGAACKGCLCAKAGRDCGPRCGCYDPNTHCTRQPRKTFFPAGNDFVSAYPPFPGLHSPFPTGYPPIDPLAYAPTGWVETGHSPHFPNPVPGYLKLQAQERRSSSVPPPAQKRLKMTEEASEYWTVLVGKHSRLTPEQLNIMATLAGFDWGKLAANDPVLKQEYIRFIFLKVLQGDSTMPTKLCPSAAIDEVWQAHLLRPQSYVALCKIANDGQLIEHDPDWKEFDTTYVAYKRTRYFYSEIFYDHPPSECWPATAPCPEILARLRLPKELIPPKEVNYTFPHVLGGPNEKFCIILCDAPSGVNYRLTVIRRTPWDVIRDYMEVMEGIPPESQRFFLFDSFQRMDTYRCSTIGESYHKAGANFGEQLIFAEEGKALQ